MQSLFGWTSCCQSGQMGAIDEETRQQHRRPVAPDFASDTLDDDVSMCIQCAHALMRPGAQFCVNCGASQPLVRPDSQSFDFDQETLHPGDSTDAVAPLISPPQMLERAQAPSQQCDAAATAGGALAAAAAARSELVEPPADEPNSDFASYAEMTSPRSARSDTGNSTEGSRRDFNDDVTLLQSLVGSETDTCTPSFFCALPGFSSAPSVCGGGGDGDDGGVGLLGEYEHKCSPSKVCCNGATATGATANCGARTNDGVGGGGASYGGSEAGFSDEGSASSSTGVGCNEDDDSTGCSAPPPSHQHLRVAASGRSERGGGGGEGGRSGGGGGGGKAYRAAGGKHGGLSPRGCGRIGDVGAATRAAQPRRADSPANGAAHKKDHASATVSQQVAGACACGSRRSAPAAYFKLRASSFTVLLLLGWLS